MIVCWLKFLHSHLLGWSYEMCCIGGTCIPLLDATFLLWLKDINPTFLFSLTLELETIIYFCILHVFLGHDGLRDVEGNELPRLVYVYVSFCFLFLCLFGCFVSSPWNDSYWLLNWKQINMKGFAWIQGPIYVMNGCGFRRYALNVYDAPVMKKSPSKTCNCWPKWCCLCFPCCASRKKKNANNTKDRKKKVKHSEASKQIHALENIEAGNEGESFGSFGFPYCSKHSMKYAW